MHMLYKFYRTVFLSLLVIISAGSVVNRVVSNEVQLTARERREVEIVAQRAAEAANKWYRYAVLNGGTPQQKADCITEIQLEDALRQRYNPAKLSSSQKVLNVVEDAGKQLLAAGVQHATINVLSTVHQHGVWGAADHYAREAAKQAAMDLLPPPPKNREKILAYIDERSLPSLLSANDEKLVRLKKAMLEVDRESQTDIIQAGLNKKLHEWDQAKADNSPELVTAKRKLTEEKLKADIAKAELDSATAESKAKENNASTALLNKNNQEIAGLMKSGLTYSQAQLLLASGKVFHNRDNKENEKKAKEERDNWQSLCNAEHDKLSGTGHELAKTELALTVAEYVHKLGDNKSATIDELKKKIENLKIELKREKEKQPQQ